MWKPSSVVEVIEHARYVEEHLDLKGGNKTIFPHQPRFMRKAPRTLSRGGSLRPPPYGNRVVPRALIVGISMEETRMVRNFPREDFKIIDKDGEEFTPSDDLKIINEDGEGFPPGEDFKGIGDKDGNPHDVFPPSDDFKRKNDYNEKFPASEDGNEYFPSKDGDKFLDYVQNDHTEDSIPPDDD